MPDQPSEPLDIRTIHTLAKMMKRYDMTAIDLVEGEKRIRLRRRGADQPVAQAVAPASQVAPAPAAQSPAPTNAPAPSTDQIIESPMVGTYYASSAPDAPPFVSVGSAVRPDSTICVIEAMKVFTDIPAALSGTITEVLVKSGQPVEFGQPLFRVRPS